MQENVKDLQLEKSRKIVLINWDWNADPCIIVCLCIVLQHNKVLGSLTRFIHHPLTPSPPFYIINPSSKHGKLFHTFFVISPPRLLLSFKTLKHLLPTNQKSIKTPLNFSIPITVVVTKGKTILAVTTQFSFSTHSIRKIMTNRLMCSVFKLPTHNNFPPFHPHNVYCCCCCCCCSFF